MSDDRARRVADDLEVEANIAPDSFYLTPKLREAIELLRGCPPTEVIAAIRAWGEAELRVDATISEQSDPFYGSYNITSAQLKAQLPRTMARKALIEWLKSEASHEANS